MSANDPVLSLSGQLVLTAFTSFAANLVLHPMCTKKNLEMSMQKNKSTSFMGLYRGFAAVCGTDAATFAVAYMANDRIKNTVSPFWAAVLAGFVSSPVVAFGEGLMANRQVNRISYYNAIRLAARPSGLILTVCREVPYNSAVFYGSPKIKNWLYFNELANQLIAGTLAGFAAGFLTTSFDRIKTHLQTSPENYSIRTGIQMLVKAEGMKGLFFKGGLWRSFYVGANVGIMNVIYSYGPQYLQPQK